MISRSRFAFGLLAIGVVTAPGWAKADNPVEVTNSIGMKLRRIPAGTFLRGATPGDADAAAFEKPQREITISRPFLVGVYEVTQGEWVKVMGADRNKSKFKGSDQLPVENVTWWEALEFCNKLSEREGKAPYYKIVGQAVTILGGNGYRLLTEAEWEYACRGGVRTKYPFGDDPARLGDFAPRRQGPMTKGGGFGDDPARLGDFAWFDGNADKKTHPVGQKLPNGFGLYDMIGNVFEWCQDGGDADYYKNAPAVDPPGPAGAPYRVLLGVVAPALARAPSRVIRGGSWFPNPTSCRPAARRWGSPEARLDFLGFRLAAVRAE
jgi:formylglycine-generating enzyme required for sulfatase activity